MIVVLPETQSNIFEVEVGERLTGKDYTCVFVPRLKALIQRYGKVRMLVSFDASFEGMEMAAVWEDTRFGMAHRNDFERIALVGAPGWVSWGMRVAAHLMGAEVRVFAESDISHALDWVKMP